MMDRGLRVGIIGCDEMGGNSVDLGRKPHVPFTTLKINYGSGKGRVVIWAARHLLAIFQ